MDSSLDERTERRLERFVGEWLTRSRVPGASVAVVEDGEPVYAGGFGSRELTTNAPATPDTLYGIASCTKSFTTLSVLMLAEDGRLSVDDPVTDHLDRVELRGADGAITLHDLMTHSSGLPSLGTSTVLLYRLTDVEEYGVPLGGRDDFYRHLNGAQDEIAGPAGERFMYNNSGYTLLGEVVSTVSERRFDEFVADEILRPLGMTRSGFDSDLMEADDAMTPHALIDGQAEPTPYPHRPLSYPAGGLIAPVTELTSYLRLQMNGGSVDGAELVSSDTLARAHEGHQSDAHREYGYGWSRETVAGRTVIGHGGSLGVSSSYLGFTEDGQYGVAIGANTTPEPRPPTVGHGLFAILTGQDPYTTVPYFARTRRFDQLTGEYESYRGIKTATVEEDAGTLRLTTHGALGDQSSVLLPTSPEAPGSTFEAPTMSGHRKPVEFDTDGDGVDLYHDRNRYHKR